MQLEAAVDLADEIAVVQDHAHLVGLGTPQPPHQLLLGPLEQLLVAQAGDVLRRALGLGYGELHLGLGLGLRRRRRRRCRLLHLNDKALRLGVLEARRPPPLASALLDNAGRRSPAESHTLALSFLPGLLLPAAFLSLLLHHSRWEQQLTVPAVRDATEDRR